MYEEDSEHLNNERVDTLSDTTLAEHRPYAGDVGPRWVSVVESSR